MANKLDTDKPLFVGPTAVREGTVVDHLRKAVSQLDGGNGVSYADLEAYMLKNFTPGKSGAYSASYIKSYVRDGVNKYGHLSHTNGGHEYAVLAAPERKARESKPRKPTKAQEEKLTMLRLIRDQGDIGDISQLDSFSLEAEDFGKATGRKQKTVDRILGEMQEEGAIRIANVQGNVEGETVRRVYLTPEGYTAINAAQPEGAGSDETPVPTPESEALEATNESEAQPESASAEGENNFA